MIIDGFIILTTSSPVLFFVSVARKGLGELCLFRDERIAVGLAGLLNDVEEHGTRQRSRSSDTGARTRFIQYAAAPAIVGKLPAAHPIGAECFEQLAALSDHLANLLDGILDVLHRGLGSPWRALQRQARERPRPRGETGFFVAEAGKEGAGGRGDSRNDGAGLDLCRHAKVS
ncbi:MAG: hypothetical protein R3E51_00785 [Rhizobiaceae bacterium]